MPWNVSSVDGKMLSASVLDIKFQFVMSVQWPVLSKHQATTKKAIWSENVLTAARSVAINEHFLLQLEEKHGVKSESRIKTE